MHDGYTLADVVSYSRNHNHANGEDNRDGRADEIAAHFGAGPDDDGPTDDAAIRRTRARVQRAMLATLLLAQGTPLLNAGDEIGNSQQGNNNAYCQDNATGWLDWTHADRELLAFVQQVLALRLSEPALRHDRWFKHAPCAPGERSLAWLAPPATRCRCMTGTTAASTRSPAVSMPRPSRRTTRRRAASIC